MRTKTHEIPGRIVQEWDDEVKAIIDHWENYFITLDQFKEVIMNYGVNYAKDHGVKAWIANSYHASGAFPQEIQDYIGSDCFPMFAKIGVKYFITINSKVSSITKMTVKNYASKTGPNGLQLVDIDTLEDAIAWLKSH